MPIEKALQQLEVRPASCANNACLGNAKTSCASADLLNFGALQNANIAPIELIHLIEANMVGGEIQPHTNSICRYADFGFPCGKAFSLFAAYFGRQTAIYHRNGAPHRF